MTGPVLGSVTGHMVIAGLHLPLPPILYSLCLQLAPQLVLVLYLVG